MYSQKDLVDYFATEKAYNVNSGKLENRVQYIVDLVLKTFGLKLDWWAFDYYEDSDGPQPTPQINEKDSVEDEFHWYVCTKGGCDAMTTDNWDYGTGFPIKFLFMEDSEIVEIIRSDIQADKENKISEKAKRKLYLEKKKELDQRLAKEAKKIKKELGIK